MESFQDKALAEAIFKERLRQETHIELIASENFVSLDVLAAQGSILTNKYAEGYPGKRYYGGCFAVDEIESLAIKRACALFSCQFANVQPHSGSQANQAVFLALLSPGDCVLSLDLNAGGHLSHGAPVNLAGKWFRIVSYGVDSQTHRIDIDQVRDLARRNRPKLIIVGASAYPRTIDFKVFREIADEVGAYLMADIAHIAGLVAAGLHPSPFPHAHVVTSTTHKTLRGPRGGLILCDEKSLARRLNQAVFPGLQGGPLMHVVTAKAVCFYEAAQPSFKSYSQKVIDNARCLGEALQNRGFSLISGGTENHLLIVDLRACAFSGHEAEVKLDQVGITCNKEGVPEDTRPPRETSGIRLGTPAVTSRGFGAGEMEKIAQWMAEVLWAPQVDMEGIRAQVESLCREKPLPYAWASQRSA